MTSGNVIADLSAALQRLPAESLATPPAQRVGAVLVIVETGEDGDVTLVYTRRRDDLRSHPGQISFPGGRVDPGETVEQAAVREANEEVGLDPAGVELLGRLPAFYIPPSRFWMQAVLAHWRNPHQLHAAEAEVAAVLHVPLSRLLDEDAWRVVRLSVSGWTWAWDLGDGHLLWGATAILTTVILGLIDPQWHGGKGPEDFPDREVRPWDNEGRVIDRRLAPRIAGVPERTPPDVLVLPMSRPTPASTERAALAVAEAALAVGQGGPATILVGSGGTGAVGRAVAALLEKRGIAVAVVDAATFDDATLPRAAVIVDALLGAGLVPPLGGAPLRLVHALRMHSTPVVSVDLPSGLDADAGLVGDVVSADVTVALGGIAPALLLPGPAPFVGDLYVARFDDDAPLLERVIAGDASDAETWRE